jgi:HEAT repeat protein
LVLEDNSDIIFNIAVLLGLTIIAAILLLILTVSLLRIKLVHTSRRQAAFMHAWDRIFDETRNAGIPAELPRIAVSDRFMFLALWIRQYESNSDIESACARLKLLFRRTGMELAANQMLRANQTKQRLAAIVALGYVRNQIEWDELYNTAFSSDPFLSLVAGHALVHIDKKKAAPTFLELIRRHTDWPTSKVAGILDEIGPTHITTSLINLISESPLETKKILIPYLTACERGRALEFTRDLLENPEDDFLIAPCIRVISSLNDRESAPLIRQYINHERWHIRVMAANCLGIIGNTQDRDLLTPLLNDRQWWVRYRAAQAISRLPDMTKEKILQLRDSLSDKYGREVLTQVTAELDAAGNE